jgi:hypothetical protein
MSDEDCSCDIATCEHCGAIYDVHTPPQSSGYKNYDWGQGYNAGIESAKAQFDRYARKVHILFGILDNLDNTEYVLESTVRNTDELTYDEKACKGSERLKDLLKILDREVEDSTPTPEYPHPQYCLCWVCVGLRKVLKRSTL